MAKTQKKVATKSASKTKKVKKIEKTSAKRCELKVWQKVITCVVLMAVPLIGGVLTTLFTIDAQEAFSKFEQPFLAPPAWLFPVAWTILYLLMGLASYFIIISKPKDKVERRLRFVEIVIYCVQLLFNFAWTLIFFNLDAKFFAFGWLLALWMMILTLMMMCWHNRRVAVWLLLPYILWCTFAAYLNISIAILN